MFFVACVALPGLLIAGPKFAEPLPPPMLPLYIQSCIQQIIQSSDKRDCDNVDVQELKQKYLTEEGAHNRGVLFYTLLNLFIAENGGHQKGDRFIVSFDKSQIFDYLGNPDFKKFDVRDNDTIDQYAYVFSYHGQRNWVAVLYVTNNSIYRIGLSETQTKIDRSWDQY